MSDSANLALPYIEAAQAQMGYRRDAMGGDGAGGMAGGSADAAAALVAVNPEKVAVPSTPATGEVPPRVQAPAPTAAETEAVLVVVFPY